LKNVRKISATTRPIRSTKVFISVPSVRRNSKVKTLLGNISSISTKTAFNTRT
jgi:hypothetical protein